MLENAESTLNEKHISPINNANSRNMGSNFRVRENKTQKLNKFDLKSMA